MRRRRQKRRRVYQNKSLSAVCGFLRFVVHGLIPGETYVFRVQAVNVFGLSDESQESSPISVEPALGETPPSPHSHI